MKQMVFFFSVLTVFIFTYGSKNEDLYLYYPNGFGDGDIKTIMSAYQDQTPESNKNLNKIRPIFATIDPVTKKIESSYDLLSEHEKENIGFLDGDDFNDYLKSNISPLYSIVKRIGKEDFSQFTLISIVKSKTFHGNYHHEIFHINSLYFNANYGLDDFAKKITAISGAGDVLAEMYKRRLEETIAETYAAYQLELDSKSSGVDYLRLRSASILGNKSVKGYEWSSYIYGSGEILSLIDDGKLNIDNGEFNSIIKSLFNSDFFISRELELIDSIENYQYIKDGLKIIK